MLLFSKMHVPLDIPLSWNNTQLTREMVAHSRALNKRYLMWMAISEGPHLVLDCEVS